MNRPVLAHGLLIALTVGSSHVAGQHVQWHINNGWQDASCDAVCSTVGFKCTEDCWPATVAGLQAAVSAPHLSGVCYSVARGDPAQWHPAKDAANTICYWNPGQVTQFRCPVASVTDASAATTGGVTRRLCPCLNQTATTIQDCGIGGALALPRFSGSSSNSQPSLLSATSTTLAVAPTTTPAPVSAKQFVAVPQACSLCVSGFGADDASLNGLYARVSFGSSLSWNKGNIILVVGDNDYWQFKERQLDGRYVPISQGSALASANSLTPLSEFFTTSLGGWSVNFKSSCGASCTESSANMDSNLDEGSGIGAGVVVLIVLATLSLVVFATVVIYYYSCRKRPFTLRPSLNDDDLKYAQKSPTKLEASDARIDPELGGIPYQFRTIPEDIGGLRQSADVGKNRSSPSPPLPHHVESLRSPSQASDFYEGPVNPWWNGDAGSQRSPSASSRPDLGWRGRKDSIPKVGRTNLDRSGVSMHNYHGTAEYRNDPHAKGWNQSIDSQRLTQGIASSRSAQHGPSTVSKTNASSPYDFPAPPLPPPATAPSDCGSDNGAPSVRSAYSKFSGMQPARWKSGKTIRGPQKEVAPATKAMALAPISALSGSLKGALSKPASRSKQTKQVRIPAVVSHGMLDDLALAQKRNQAKLNALKAQLER